MFVWKSHKSEIELNVARKPTKDWSTFPLFDLIKFSQSIDQNFLDQTWTNLFQKYSILQMLG